MSGIDLAKHPPWWLRLTVGVLGSSLVTAPPFAVRFLAVNFDATDAVRNFVIGTGIVFGCAWAVSVLLTTVMQEDHILKCFLTSIGIPGFAVSMTIGTQAFQ